MIAEINFSISYQKIAQNWLQGSNKNKNTNPNYYIIES